MMCGGDPPDSLKRHLKNPGLVNSLGFFFYSKTGIKEEI